MQGEYKSSIFAVRGGRGGIVGGLVLLGKCGGEDVGQSILCEPFVDVGRR
jgi:hypothetical protein